MVFDRWRASRCYLHQSLLDLQKGLATINVRIRFLSGSENQQLPAVAHETGTSRIVWNRVVEPSQENMDEQIRSVRSAAGLSVEIYADGCLLLAMGGRLRNRCRGLNQDSAVERSILILTS